MKSKDYVKELQPRLAGFEGMTLTMNLGTLKPQQVTFLGVEPVSVTKLENKPKAREKDGKNGYPPCVRLRLDKGSIVFVIEDITEVIVSIESFIIRTANVEFSLCVL